MSNSKIRTLFYEKLKEGLKLPDGKLKLLILQPNITLSDEAKDLYERRSHVVVSLVPAPTGTQTLNGDHKRFTGIYQVDVKIILGINESDASIQLDAIQKDLQDIFKVDMLLKDPDNFEVQVISPLKTTEAKQFKQWWTCHCYFDYRADTN